jgi:hypothetical protein
VVNRTGSGTQNYRCPKPFSALLRRNFDDLSTGSLDVDELLLQTKTISQLYSLMGSLTIVTMYTQPVERRFQSLLLNISSLLRN